MNRATQSGFTLWELMFTLAVAGIVLGIGVPSFKEFLRNNAMSAAVNDVVTGVLLARAEAVKRQVPVTLCASADPNAAAPACGTFSGGGAGGYIVFVDENGNDVLTDSTDGNAKLDSGETVLLRRTAPGGQIAVWADGGSYITYGTNGFKTTKASGQAKDSITEMLFCDDRGNEARGDISTARLVNIDWAGRADVETSHDKIAGAVGDFTGASCP
jgi:type IV fimbrial biogenesis protein FimT